VWDLEGGTGAEVASAGEGFGIDDEDEEEKGDENDDILSRDLKGTVIFDERRIISAGVRGVQIRRFDV